VETVQNRDKLGKLEQIEVLEPLEELCGRVLGLALRHDDGQVINKLMLGFSA
jgi:hypothetical protein